VHTRVSLVRDLLTAAASPSQLSICGQDINICLKPLLFTVTLVRPVFRSAMLAGRYVFLFEGVGSVAVFHVVLQCPFRWRLAFYHIAIGRLGFF